MRANIFLLASVSRNLCACVLLSLESEFEHRFDVCRCRPARLTRKLLAAIGIKCHRLNGNRGSNDNKIAHAQAVVLANKSVAFRDDDIFNADETLCLVAFVLFLLTWVLFCGMFCQPDVHIISLPVLLPASNTTLLIAGTFFIPENNEDNGAKCERAEKARFLLASSHEQEQQQANKSKTIKCIR